MPIGSCTAAAKEQRLEMEGDDGTASRKICCSALRMHSTAYAAIALQVKHGVSQGYRS